MFSLKKKNDVRDRVMAVVEERIATGQKEYEEKAVKIDEKVDAEIVKLNEKRDTDKSDALATIVSKVLKP